MSRASPCPTISATAWAASSTSSRVMTVKPATFAGIATTSFPARRSGVISDPSFTHCAWGSLVTIGTRRTSCRPTGITVVVCMATLIACTGCTMSGPKASGSHALAKSLRETTISSPSGYECDSRAEPLARCVAHLGRRGWAAAPGRGRPPAPYSTRIAYRFRSSILVGVDQVAPRDQIKIDGGFWDGPRTWHHVTEPPDAESFGRCVDCLFHLVLIWAAPLVDEVGDRVPGRPQRLGLQVELFAAQPLDHASLERLYLPGEAVAFGFDFA